jgi:S-adenosylmethionine synthetase
MKTAEYARRGHPDRVCDIIADSLLDEFLKQDPNSRVALEVFGCHGIITVGGEVTTKGYVDVIRVVKDVYKEIGYNDTIGVQVNIVSQSPEIKKMADKGAGDSGIVVGYATNETKEMLPL